MSADELVDGKEIQRQLKIGERLLWDLRRKKLIPYTKFGHRTIRYDVEAVRTAMKKLTVK